VASLKIGRFESHLASESLTFKKKRRLPPINLVSSRVGSRILNLSQIQPVSLLTAFRLHLNHLTAIKGAKNDEGHI